MIILMANMSNTSSKATPWRFIFCQIEWIDLVRLLSSYLMPMESSFSATGCENSLMSLFLDVVVCFSLASIPPYSSGSISFIARSSISDLML